MRQKGFLFAMLALQLWAVFPSYGDKGEVAKFLYQANQLFQKKKYDDAIFYFKKAVEADPSDATLHYNIGVVYQMKGKAFYGHAKNWYKKALEKDKTLAFALYNIGIISYSEHKFDEARKLLESARILKPQDKTIQEALRAVKKTLALQQSMDEKIQKKQEDDEPSLSGPKPQTEPLTKTAEPSVTETKTQSLPLTKTQKTVPPENKKETKKKKESESVKTKPAETKTQPLTKTQKTVKPDIKITETKPKTEGAAKKTVENKNVKAVVCADIKNRAPVSLKETFSSADKQVVVWLELKSMQGNHDIESRWYAPDGKLYSSGTQKVQISGPRYRTWMSRKLVSSQMGSKKGAWQVEILIDKASVKRVNFSVQ